MKNTYLLVFLLTSLNVFAQNVQEKTLELEARIVVIDLDKVSLELESLFREGSIIPEYYIEKIQNIETEFYLSDTLFYDFQERINAWGYVKNKKSTSYDYNKRLEVVEEDIRETEKQIESYKAVLKEMDINHQKHYTFWDKLEKAEGTLRMYEKQRSEIIDKNKKFKIKLIIDEENINSTNSQRPDFSLINMPGIQYSYLKIENPVAGLSPTSMQGISVKYLINRRKTSLELGLYKPSFTSNTPVDGFNDMYLIGIGQDFYSSHLGRGSRKFLNLYSSAKLGAVILSTDDTNLVSWYGSPAIGIELFKTKNILIDNKIGYFLPFKENRNMRGWIYDVSFNIVF